MRGLFRSRCGVLQVAGYKMCSQAHPVPNVNRGRSACYLQCDDYAMRKDD